MCAVFGVWAWRYVGPVRDIVIVAQHFSAGWAFFLGAIRPGGTVDHAFVLPNFAFEGKSRAFSRP
jgi:hypothetical protein